MYLAFRSVKLARSALRMNAPSTVGISSPSSVDEDYRSFLGAALSVDEDDFSSSAAILRRATDTESSSEELEPLPRFFHDGLPALFWYVAAAPSFYLFSRESNWRDTTPAH